MEKYDNLAVVGEGSYGVVLKCKHKETGQVVAIKKFLETEDDVGVKKIALREIRMLKKLRHENLINLIEVFRRKRKLYLVFEYMDHTVLDELEDNPSGLEESIARKHVFQVLRGVDFCHQNNIIHRDVKPENILVSKLGVVKICDFGFARMMASPGELYTDYVATRWYRAPELLVQDPDYGSQVDIWAIGCLYAEMLSGDPLFPGDSDIDQLFHIVRCLGPLSAKHRDMIARNPMYDGINISNKEPARIANLFPTWSQHSLNLVHSCLEVEPSARPPTADLLRLPLFTHDNFSEWFLQDLRSKLQEEFGTNPLMKKKKNLFSAGNRLKSGNTDEFKNRKNKEKTQEAAKITRRRFPETEGLFDEVFKKASLYSQKYTPGKQSQNLNILENKQNDNSAENKRDSSAKSQLLLISPGGHMELENYQDDKDVMSRQSSQSKLSPTDLGGQVTGMSMTPRRQICGDQQPNKALNSVNSVSPRRQTGLKRYEGFDQGLNNSNIYKSGVFNQSFRAENTQKSPPNKKTKKRESQMETLPSPKIQQDQEADKFTFLERAFDKAFQLEEYGPKSLTPGPSYKDSYNRQSGKVRGRNGDEDFWLPSLNTGSGSGSSGGTNGNNPPPGRLSKRNNRNAPQDQFHCIVEGVTPVQSAKNNNLPHV